MATTVFPYTQYGGIWKLNSASAAKGAGTWPVPPQPALYSWGANASGQLGLDNRTSYSSPKQVGSLTNWDKLGAGLFMCAAIKTDGTFWSWGISEQGQLGLGNTTNYSSPKQVGSLTNWSKVFSAKGRSTFSVKTDGTLWAWGQNIEGQLGLGNRTLYSSPKQVGSLTNWSIVVNGTNATVAIKTDGTLWAWGFNGVVGELGLNNRTSYSSPKQVGSLTDWVYLDRGDSHTAAIRSNGTLWTWGANNNGQLGLGNTTNYSSPKQVGSLTDWSKVYCSLSQTYSIKTDGTIWAWGENNLGQLGLGNRTNYSSPKQIGALTNWSNGTGGFDSTAAIKTDGTLWGWGNNSAGQLGLGNTTQYSSPKQVGSLTSWQTVSSSRESFYGIAKV